jgi:DegV family protein with EDD domain
VKEAAMIKIVTDSLADLSPAYLAEYDNIRLVPSYVTFGAQTMRDNIDIMASDFYDRLVRSKELPTTSQASVADFENAYREVIGDDPGTVVLSLQCSGSLSGSIESARQAARNLSGCDIRVFDTRMMSLGQGLMVVEAARLATQGSSAEDILKRMEIMRDNMQAYYILNTLDYLFKGGRIGRAARLMGTLLDMKPMLTLQDGVVTPHERYRSRPTAINALREKALEHARGHSHVYLGVAHGVCADDADAVANDLLKEISPELMLRGEVGPAIGTYTGPGVLGIFVWATN